MCKGISSIRAGSVGAVMRVGELCICYDFVSKPVNIWVLIVPKVEVEIVLLT
jgi:hypothetical protein